MLVALITGLLPILSHAAVIEETAIDKTAQGASFNKSIDVSKYNRLSVQAIYSTSTIATSLTSDGRYSSATITVVDYAYLDGRTSSATITQFTGNNTSAIDGAVITINGRAYTEGIDWSRGFSSTNTMASLAAALTAHPEYDAYVSSNIITLQSVSSGTAANSWSLTSSVPTRISTTPWAAGQPHGYLAINGTTLTEGTAWNAETSAAVTALNIRDAINANSTLSALTTAYVQASGVVRVTARSVGVNAYPINVSSYPALTYSFVTLMNGATTDVSLTGDTFYEPSHGFGEGLAVVLSTAAGSAPTGLAIKTTYYVIPIDTNYFQLADSSTMAVAGSEIDITAVAGESSFNIRPIALTVGPAAFTWKASNDGTNFTVLNITTNTVLYTTPTNTVWDLGEYAYKYLRIAFTGPTWGGINLAIKLFGRE